MDRNDVTLGEALDDPRARNLTVASVLRSYYGLNKRNRALAAIGAVVGDKLLVRELSLEEREVIVGVEDQRPGNGSPVAVARRVAVRAEASKSYEDRVVKPRLSAEAEALRDAQEKLKDEARRRRMGEDVGTRRALEGARDGFAGLRRCWEGD